MLKVVIFLIIQLIVSTKKIHIENKVDCIKEKCTLELKDCFEINECASTIDKCKQQWQGINQKKNAEQMSLQQLTDCLKQNETAYKFINCTYYKCFVNSQTAIAELQYFIKHNNK